MSYQVLARKWRPRSFPEMVGQGHVLRALVNALDQERLHHAYLFTGTRGVGKTTLARILAKSLNCERGVGSRPCGECDACLEIDGGRFVDLIEVDAASRTKVEDTRELLDNVQYAPTRGRFKVYLIDEVHMLSGHSFNALLKTLEEPPPHVKFLLATTDPQKLPVTILSRCLQFNLKALRAGQILEHLEHVLEKEGIEAERAGLAALARAAQGSMRDALSLLDQAIAFGNGAVREADVGEMLGTVSRELLGSLLTALCRRDGVAVMGVVEGLADQAPDFADVLAELLSVLHRAAMAQYLVEEPGEDDDGGSMVARVAGSLTPEAIQLYYQIALMGRRDLPLAPDPRMGFEMTVLRMLSFAPEESVGVAAAPQSDAAAPSSRNDGAAAAGAGTSEVREGVAAAPGSVPAAGPTGAVHWPDLLQSLGLKGMAQALASNCSLKEVDADRFVLVLGEAHSGLRTANAEKRLEAALCGHFGRKTLKLRIEVGEHHEETLNQIRDRRQEERQRCAEQAIDEDRVVRGLMEDFGASIVPGSIRPVEGDGERSDTASAEDVPR